MTVPSSSSLWLRGSMALAMCAALGLSPIARGQQGNSVTAEALFDEGLKKYDAQDYEGACKAFEGSNKLQPGVGVMLRMADCYEKVGRVASAWAAFREAAAMAKRAGQSERETLAARRASALDPKLPRASVRVSPKNAETPGFTIKRDGIEVVREAWETPLPTDPGPHVYEASAPGKNTLRFEITVNPNEPPVTITIGDLRDAPVAASASAMASAPAVAPPPKVAASRPSWQTPTGLVLGGVGLVGVGLGTYFGLRASSLTKDADRECDPQNRTRCTARGASLGDDARAAATLSNVSFGVGGALLIGGVVTLLWPTSNATTGALRVSPIAARQSTGLSLEGTW